MQRVNHRHLNRKMAENARSDSIVAQFEMQDASVVSQRRQRRSPPPQRRDQVYREESIKAHLPWVDDIQPDQECVFE